MDIHLIVDLAFCTGFAFAFKPLSRLINKMLTNKQQHIENSVKETLSLENQSKTLLNNTLIRNKEIDVEIDQILNNAYVIYNEIIEAGKKDIEKIVEEHLNYATKNISDKIVSIIQSLRINATDIAATASQQLIQEYLKNPKHNNEINSTLARDLRKKLH